MGVMSIFTKRSQGDLGSHRPVIMMATLSKLAEIVIKDAATEHGKMPEW